VAYEMARRRSSLEIENYANCSRGRRLSPLAAPAHRLSPQASPAPHAHRLSPLASPVPPAHRGSPLARRLSPVATASVSRASTRSETRTIEVPCGKPQQPLGRALALDTTVSAKKRIISPELQTHFSRSSPKRCTLPQSALQNKPREFPKSHAGNMPAHVDRTARSSCYQGGSLHHGSNAKRFEHLVTSKELDEQFEQELAAMDVADSMGFGDFDDVDDYVFDEPALDEELKLTEFLQKVVSDVESSPESIVLTIRGTNRVETSVRCTSHVTTNLARLQNKTPECELLSQVSSSGVVTRASSVTDSGDHDAASESNIDIVDLVGRLDIDV